MSLSLLTRQPITWDSEAASYISSVESADTQSLESTVARAINQFVIDCKVRGIWGSIKSCCLLCGARTLSGALVPLKGTAPTNVNFVSGDYNRKNGLKGDGSTKYLDSNRPSNSDPQDNNHISCYVNSVPSIVGSYYMGVVYGITGTAFTAITSNLFYNRDGNRSYTQTTGFHATSRDSSVSFISRVNSSSVTTSATSKAPNSDKYYIFARSVGYAQSYTDARLSFYSIGESLDLRLLDQCITKYSNTLNILL